MADKFEFTPRTCEEYVLHQLMEAETELEELAEKSKDLAVESFANAIQLAALKKFLKDRIVLRMGEASARNYLYITNDFIWEETPEFEMLCETLDIDASQDMENPEPAESDGKEEEGES